MKKIIPFLFILSPGIVNAEGPLFKHNNPATQQEFENVYQGIRAFSSFFKIGQVVVFTSDTVGSTTSSAFADTNLSSSITPTNINNKILVLATGVLRTGNAGASNAYATLTRGSTNLGAANGFQAIASSAANAFSEPMTICYLDSPQSTSPTTYKVQIKDDDAATTVTFGGATTRQVMILVELIK